ncbi:MAG: DUF6320 domain-containing protein [bacterium]|nr:DUF6320 domain-containing protein [bacterium]
MIKIGFCKNCRIKINNNSTTCPLCFNKVEKVGNDSSNVFPKCVSIYEKEKPIFRILIAISILITVSSIIINLLTLKKLNWSLFVTLGLITSWVAFINTWKRKDNPIVVIFNQLILIGIVAIIIDYLTGFHLWSFGYVVPFLAIAAVVEIILIAHFLKCKITEYTFQFVIIGIVEISQLILIDLKYITITWPSILAIICCLIFVSLFVIIEHNNVKGELERRFHI